MFDTLDNAAERHKRRLERERKMQLMEDAAAMSSRSVAQAHISTPSFNLEHGLEHGDAGSMNDSHSGGNGSPNSSGDLSGGARGIGGVGVTVGMGSQRGFGGGESGGGSQRSFGTQGGKDGQSQAFIDPNDPHDRDTYGPNSGHPSRSSSADMEHHGGRSGDEMIDYVETGGRGFGTGVVANAYASTAAFCNMICTPKRAMVSIAVVGMCVFAIIVGVSASRKHGGEGESSLSVGIGYGGSGTGTGAAPPSGGGGQDRGGPATSNLIDDMTATERFRAIRDRIVLADVSDEADLADPPKKPKGGGDAATDGAETPTTIVATPQYLAADWLASKDPMQLPPDDPNLMYRYALAVFWYATHETAAQEDALNPPSDDDEEYANWDRHDNWMSGKGICLWYGVQCHHVGEDIRNTRFDGNGKVTYFNITSNDVRGPIPKEFFRVHTDMRHLNLSNNSITGTLPDLFREWTELEDFFLNSNYIEGTLPKSLMSEWHAQTLKNLDLGNNWLEGPLPTTVGHLTALRRMSLYENELTGTLPSQLGKCTELRDLYLDVNLLTGSVPETIYDLTHLTDLRLRHNKLVGTISESIFKLAELEILYMDTNRFTGNIPFRLDDVPHLEELHLYNNALTGTLPPELNELHHLKVLYLDTNRLTGSIPPEWAAFLHDLKQLFLYDNELTGQLPKSLGRLEDMVDLRLNGNKFTGTIPDALGTLFHLEHVALENNNFIGIVPESLGQLEKLQALKLHMNELTGTIPPSICDLRTQLGSLDVLSADCRADTDDIGDDGHEERKDDGAYREIECVCCTECFRSVMPGEAEESKGPESQIQGVPHSRDR